MSARASRVHVRSGSFDDVAAPEIDFGEPERADVCWHEKVEGEDEEFAGHLGLIHWTMARHARGRFALRDPMVDEEDWFQEACFGALQGFRRWHAHGRKLKPSTFMSKGACWHVWRVINHMLVTKRRSKARPLSLDFQTDEEAEVFYALLAIGAPKSARNDYEHHLARELRVLEHEKPKLAQILQQRFFGNLTLEQVGNTFGVSRERIRQLEEKGLARLREKMRAREAAAS